MKIIWKVGKQIWNDIENVVLHDNYFWNGILKNDSIFSIFKFFSPHQSMWLVFRLRNGETANLSEMETPNVILIHELFEDKLSLKNRIQLFKAVKIISPFHGRSNFLEAIKIFRAGPKLHWGFEFETYPFGFRWYFLDKKLRKLFFNSLQIVSNNIKC